MHAEDWLAQQGTAPKPVSTPTAIMDTMGNMAMFGAAPKLSGAIAGVESKLKGQDYTPAYEAERDRAQRMFDTEAGQLNPIVRTAARIGGAVLNPANEALGAVGNLAGRAMGSFGNTMLGRVLSQGTIPAALGGATQAVGTTVGSPSDYGKNALLQSLFGAAAGTALGTAGQVVGKYRAALTGARQEPELYAQAKSADLYDDDVPNGYIDKFLRAVNGTKPERPIIAQAYQLAQEKAASMGEPLPDLPISTPEARAAEALRGRANPDQPTLPAGLSLRVIDETKKALNAMVRAPGGGALKDVEGAYYRDFVEPVKQAVPEYADALSAHTDVAQAKDLSGRLSPASTKSLPATIAGGIAGLAAGHPAGGATAARVLSALAQTAAARDATAGLTPRVAQGLSPAVGQLVSMILANHSAQSGY